jgi:hypothetical protein
MERKQSMKHSFRSNRPVQRFFGATALGIGLLVGGCASSDLVGGSDTGHRPIVQAPANFDTALKQNQAALNARRGPQDVALYNIGVILAHPSNPRRDHAKAAQSFHALVNEHPKSAYAEQAKTWIQVLEQQQRLADERQKLLEDRRALNREREMLAQERQKLNYASEKSQQLDMEIERRRRQSLAR